MDLRCQLLQKQTAGSKSAPFKNRRLRAHLCSSLKRITWHSTAGSESHVHIQAKVSARTNITQPQIILLGLDSHSWPEFNRQPLGFNSCTSSWAHALSPPRRGCVSVRKQKRRALKMLGPITHQTRLTVPITASVFYGNRQDYQNYITTSSGRIIWLTSAAKHTGLHSTNL